MALEGGCYCGAVRYVAEGEPAMKAQCHCRECQHHSGGGPNFFMLMPLEGFYFSKGAPSAFSRSDIDNPVTREFCAACGTQIGAPVRSMGMYALKVGTLDDPSRFGGPQVALHTCDKQRFHHIGEALATFEKNPE